MSGEGKPGFKGRVINGKRHGYGEQAFQNGDAYRGNWENDKPNGVGAYTYANGASYEGNFVDGMRHGRGKYRFAAGDVYDGEWRQGQRTGKGRIKVVAREGVDGFIYDGDFLEGKRHGNGKLMYDDGEKYQGQFVQEERHGQGSLMLLSGDVYTGKFEHDAPHGVGEYFYAKKQRVFGVIFMRGQLTRQLCPKSVGDPCVFTEESKHMCTRCKTPSLVAMMEQEQATAPGGAGQEGGLNPQTLEAKKHAQQLLQDREALMGMQVGEVKGFVRVLDVREQSTAAQIGLGRGLYVLRLNGIDVRSTAKLFTIVSQMDIGENGSIVVATREDPPTPPKPIPKSAMEFTFRIGGNLHLKEMEFLSKVAEVTKPITKKTLENLAKVKLRPEPIFFPA